MFLGTVRVARLDATPTTSRHACVVVCLDQEYLEKKYGKGAGTRMASSLEKAGQSTGINFNNDRRVHNTILSHRLVRLADEQGKGGEMIDQIFHGYFEQGRNIADSTVLLDMAEKVCVT